MHEQKFFIFSLIIFFTLPFAFKLLANNFPFAHTIQNYTTTACKTQMPSLVYIRKLFLPPVYKYSSHCNEKVVKPPLTLLRTADNTWNLLPLFCELLTIRGTFCLTVTNYWQSWNLLPHCYEQLMTIIGCSYSCSYCYTCSEQSGKWLGEISRRVMRGKGDSIKSEGS